MTLIRQFIKLQWLLLLTFLAFKLDLVVDFSPKKIHSMSLFKPLRTSLLMSLLEYFSPELEPLPKSAIGVCPRSFSTWNGFSPIFTFIIPTNLLKTIVMFPISCSFFLTYWCSLLRTHKSTYRFLILNTVPLWEFIAQSLTLSQVSMKTLCTSSLLLQLPSDFHLYPSLDSPLLWCFLYCSHPMDLLIFILDITFSRFSVLADHLPCSDDLFTIILTDYFSCRHLCFFNAMHVVGAQ